MRRAPPLAALVLLSAAITASAAGLPCPVRDGERLLDALPPDHPDCAAYGRSLPDFERLSRAAGFATGTLGYFVHPDASEAAAHYAATTKAVFVKRGYLAAGRPPAALRATLAHEIGHAVQDRDGLLRWRNEPLERFTRAAAGSSSPPGFAGSPEHWEFLDRGRRVEAHADAIAQELMVAAGYPANEVALHRERSFGCAQTRDDPMAGVHPRHAQRYLNATLAASTLAAERSRRAAERAAAALAAGELGPDEAAAAVAFRPASSIHDFDGQGRLLPGRLVSMPLRVSPPPPGAGLVRERAQSLAGSVVDYWVAEPVERAVNALALSRPLTEGILESCGRPESAAAAADFGITRWIARISGDAVSRLGGP